MGHTKETQATTEAQEIKKDYSCDFPCIIMKLRGLSQIMMKSEDGDFIDFGPIAGIGWILSDIVQQLEEMNEALYGP